MEPRRRGPLPRCSSDTTRGTPHAHRSRILPGKHRPVNGRTPGEIAAIAEQKYAEARTGPGKCPPAIPPLFRKGHPMTTRRFPRKTLATLTLVILLTGPAWALDSKVVRDIDRADTITDLANMADKVSAEAATRQPKDFEEGTRIAAETSAYLLYIVAKQNTLLLRMEEADE